MTLSLSVIIIETTVLFIIGAAALIGNASLFLVVYENKKLRTSTNIFSFNLAAADILVSGVSMPVTAVTIIKQRWIFGHATCVVFGFFTILSFIASVMSLGMIAINRYFYIVKWKTYSHTFNKKKVALRSHCLDSFSTSRFATSFWVGEIRLHPRKVVLFC